MQAEKTYVTGLRRDRTALGGARTELGGDRTALGGDRTEVRGGVAGLRTDVTVVSDYATALGSRLHPPLHGKSQGPSRRPTWRRMFFAERELRVDGSS